MRALISELVCVGCEAMLRFTASIVLENCIWFLSNSLISWIRATQPRALSEIGSLFHEPGT